MRLVTALCLIILVSSPAFARSLGGCQDIRIATKNRVDFQTPGYSKVIVEIQIPASEEGGAEDAARKGIYAFGLHTRAQGVRLGHGHETDAFALLICKRDTTTRDGRLFPGGTIWFAVRGFVKEEGEGSYTLTSTLLLPKAIISKKPLAETMLRSGMSFRGTWSEDGGKLSLVKIP